MVTGESYIWLELQYVYDEVAKYYNFKHKISSDTPEADPLMILALIL